MLKLEVSGKEFFLYYKNHLFLHHSFRTPCLEIGLGLGRFKSKYGHFKIRDKMKKRRKLISFNVTAQSPERINIEFYSELATINLTFAVTNNRLEITPNCTNPEVNRFWMAIHADEQEAVFGCGEQFSEFNLRGKNVPLWVQESGICRGDPKWLTFFMNILAGVGGHWYSTYYPQPTFISSENYYCHVETTSYAEFNFTNEICHILYIWEIPRKIILGKYESALETVSNLTKFLGIQPELPEWVYDGVWLGIQGGNEIIEQKLKRCVEKGIKVAAVWCQDWQGIRMRRLGKRLFWNWIYDKELYSNLPEFIKSLNERGIRFLGYINSFLSVEDDAPLYNEASAKGLCVKNKEGKDYFIKTGNGITALLDLTNPETIKWLKAVIKNNMIDIGLSGWMADFGEYLPSDAVLHTGENAADVHNKYPVLWAKIVRKAIEEAGKLGEIVFFTRSGYSHASKYTTLVWAGDQLVNWSKNAGFASVIPAGLSLGVCGIGYYHSDIGGYTTFWKFKRTKEIFMRWAEQAAFTMVMRTHEGNMPDRNVQFDKDEETLEHFSKMIQIHVHLKPYLVQLSQEYQKTGIPPLRAVYLHYPDDPETFSLKYQYLLGSDLLVAPVYKPQVASWKIYIPEDLWIHLWSGKELAKGWHKVAAPIGYPPVFYRKNSEFTTLFTGLRKNKKKINIDI
ncbi:MAG: alpha-glucosidase [Candidatus Helarchaeota archaeon]